MVKMVTVDDIVKDPVTGRNMIKGPAGIDGPSAFKMVHGAVMQDLMTMELPFTATGFSCTKNQDFVEKCLGTECMAKPGIKPKPKPAKAEKDAIKVAKAIEDGIVTAQEKKEIEDIVSRYVDKV